MGNYDVAAYVWPAYTGRETRTRMFWPEGMGEWQTVKNAAPKYQGHTWPRRARSGARGLQDGEGICGQPSGSGTFNYG